MLKFICFYDFYIVHAKGEVWAVILIEVYWNLVEKHGFDADWFNNLSDPAASTDTYFDIMAGKHLERITPIAADKEELKGNIIALQLIVDGMKLQPCYPSFVDARDAIIQADKLGKFNFRNFFMLY